MNESHRQPTLNLNLARAYLAARDPPGLTMPGWRNWQTRQNSGLRNRRFLFVSKDE
jgi:hypothetical protein